MAVLGPGINVNMNGHNNIHNQLTKSLERIIEDAFLSGELKLSGRKLKDFPKPVKFDLTDTVIADLSKNRFTDLPEEVTRYIYLERLLLSQNVIRAVPDAVGSLQSLTYLDLSANQLTELPREICQMPLQVLLLSNNMLTNLPKEIGKMGTLAELDASVNRLTQVPMTLGDCAGMRALNLSNNQLGLLPLQVTYLRLEHLDVSCNCISSLPLELRNMSTLVTLNLDNNPLVSPPTTVCMRGRVHIFKYLENMANKDTLPAHKRVDESRRTGKHSSFVANPPSQAVNHQIMSGNATIDCLRHRPRPVVDSGYSTDGVDKRWCNDAGVDMGGGSGRSTPSTPSTLSPGTALSRAHSLSSETPLAPLLAGLRISPDGTMSNGDEKSKLAQQQTYRQYKEALRQQRQQDVYRSRTDHPSPDPDSSPQSQNQSPVHIQRSQSSPHSPILNGYNSNNSSALYSRTISSNSSLSSVSPNISQVPNSPLLHSTPRRFQNVQNGNVSDAKADDTLNKRPVQKVVPSRNINKYNGNAEHQNGRLNGSQLRPDPEMYIKPTSPTKSPTNTLSYNSIGAIRRKEVMNGSENGAKLLTTTVSYLKGASSKPPGTGGKMAWNKDVTPDKLSFTMKREFDKQKEETELLQQLRVIIESRLKMSLPDELAPVLCDGVVLCHLANHVRPRSVASVHVPSPAQPKLTMARCRRNVDNFIEACRKIGVEEESICSAEDILSHHPEFPGACRSPRRLAVTLAAILNHATPQQRSPKDFSRPQPDNFNGCDDSCLYQHDYDTVRYHYSEERAISNFNTYSDYVIDEADEYEVYNNNNNANNYSPIYASEDTVNKMYNQNNKIQFVAPYFKKSGVLTSDNFEIYDTDEVDGPQTMLESEEQLERYDRAKMNLNIEHNLNTQLNDAKLKETVVKEDPENRAQTLMCCAADVLEGKGTVQVAITVTELLRRQIGARATLPQPPAPPTAPAPATAT